MYYFTVNMAKSKLLKILLGLCCISLFVLPYARVFDPVSESWQKTWIYEDVELLFIYTPFVLAYLPVGFLPLHTKAYRIYRYVPFLPALLVFLYSAQLLLLPAPDFIPGAAAGFSVLCLPLYALIFIEDRKKT